MFNIEELDLQNCVKGRENEWRANCCFCKETKRHLYINEVTGAFICFKCQRKGFISAITRLKGKPDPVYHWVAPVPKEKNNEWLALDQSPLAIDNDYLKSRGVSNDVIKHFQLKDTGSGIFIPFYIHDVIEGGQIRFYSGNTRYKEFGTFNGAYPVENLKDNGKPLFLVEGVFGVYKLFSYGQRAITGLGAAKSFGQYLSAIKRQQSLIWFDNDYGGVEGVKNLLTLTNQQIYAIMPGTEVDELSEFDLSQYKITNSIEEIKIYD